MTRRERLPLSGEMSFVWRYFSLLFDDHLKIFLCEYQEVCSETGMVHISKKKKTYKNERKSMKHCETNKKNIQNNEQQLFHLRQQS